MSREDESFLEAKARKKKAERGKAAETVVHKILTALAADDLNFDFDQVTDSKASVRTLPQTVADFTFCYQGQAGAIEVKETTHTHRLDLSDFPQYPRMLRRIQAGGRCLLVVHHSLTLIWRVVDVSALPEIYKGSWDLEEGAHVFTSKIVLPIALREAIYASHSK